ncbi:hypothetical protein NESM_000104500 [Novymonas esmeraldas]|uniref:Uncharacterized protein n=1 Tax=Novymonas esmeraldas TaxID=1808958 RepID=A0AAW0F5C1_9TRYP
MQCISNHSFEAADLLTDRTMAVQQLMSSRSLLPPSPSADQLLVLLHEAAHPCASLSSAKSEAPAAADWPPASFSPSTITRQCPTTRRVASSFAAAGAHSMLGEMLQLFAAAVTRLFTAGVTDPSVRAFPAEWDRRLNAPAAASLRQHHLYELQGFSTLFAFMWGQVATSLPLVREQSVAEQEGLATSSVAPTVTSTARKAGARTPTAPRPQSRLPPLSASSGTGRTSQHRGRSRSAGSSGQGRRGGSALQGRPCVPLTSAALFLPGGDAAAATAPHAGKSAQDGARSATSNRPAAQSTTLAVLQHALTAQAKAQRRFLPSIPREGLLPTSSVRSGSGTRDDARPHPETAETVGGGTTRPLASATSSIKAASPRVASNRALTVEHAMQLDRHRELRQELGIRNVRDYAAEGDMQNYLDSYRTNIRGVLGEDDDVDVGGMVRGAGGSGRV